jgi:hypothetical protein
MTIAEAEAAIDHQDFGIPGETVMLETVVQDQQIRSKLRDGPPPDPSAIATDEYRNAGGVQRKQPRLVARVRQICTESRPIRDDSHWTSPQPSVPAARQHDPSTPPVHCVRKPGRGRSLSSPPHHEVPNAENPTTKLL